MARIVGEVRLLECKVCDEKVLVIVPTSGFLEVKEFKKIIGEIDWVGSIFRKDQDYCPKHKHLQKE